MPKFYGSVVYSKTTEESQGIWVENLTEKKYYGDILKNNKRQSSGDQVNSEKLLNIIISIVADPFAYENFSDISYVEYMGVFWKVTSVEIQSPRILITVGGRYNGKSY